MLSLLWEAIIGLVVGALAKLIMPGKDPGASGSPWLWALQDRSSLRTWVKRSAGTGKDNPLAF